MSDVYLIAMCVALGLTFAQTEFKSGWWLLPAGLALVAAGFHPAVIFLCVLLMLIPTLWTNHQHKHQTQLLRKQLPDFVESLALCLKSGLSLEVAFKQTGAECPLPLKQQIDTVLHSLSFGTPLEEALKSLSDRHRQIELMHRLSDAVKLSRQTGLDASELFMRLSTESRQIQASEERILSLSSQGRLQAWILCLIPLALLLLLSLLDPIRMQHFFASPQGQVMMALVVSLETIGLLWINKLIRV